MPMAAKRPCNHPGCPALTSDGWCPAHPKPKRQTRHEQGYTNRWARFSKVFRMAHPLCEHCLVEGRTTASQEVDHILPHRGNQELFWSAENLQALCKACHSKKTATHDAGFGNAPSARYPRRGR